MGMCSYESDRYAISLTRACIVPLGVQAAAMQVPALIPLPRAVMTIYRRIYWNSRRPVSGNDCLNATCSYILSRVAVLIRLRIGGLAAGTFAVGTTISVLDFTGLRRDGLAGPVRNECTLGVRRFVLRRLYIATDVEPRIFDIAKRRASIDVSYNF